MANQPRISGWLAADLWVASRWLVSDRPLAWGWPAADQRLIVKKRYIFGQPLIFNCRTGNQTVWSGAGQRHEIFSHGETYRKSMNLTELLLKSRKKLFSKNKYRTFCQFYGYFFCVHFNLQKTKVSTLFSRIHIYHFIFL